MGIDEMDNEGIRFPFYYLSLSLFFSSPPCSRGQRNPLVAAGQWHVLDDVEVVPASHRKRLRLRN